MPKGSIRLDKEGNLRRSTIDAWGNSKLGEIVQTKAEGLAQSNSLGKRDVAVVSDSSPEQTQPAKRLRGAAPMDVDMGDANKSSMMATASNAASSTSGSNGTGETPVMLNAQPKLGLFSETHTAILPIRFGVSFNALRYESANNVLKIRMNTPYDILKDTTFVLQTEGGTPLGGVSVNQASAYTAASASTFHPFETTLITSTVPTASTTGSGTVTSANCAPGWRSWFEKIYESYHTIETHYKITLVNPEASVSLRARVHHECDVYTTSSTGNIMPVDASPFDLNSTFKNVKSVIVQERNNNDSPGWIQEISGTWRPGEWSKNTLNSEDIKAWYATGAEPTPQWVENLVLLARTDEFNSNNYMNLNVFVELRYVVQYKDLKATFRYTQPADPTIALDTPGDVLQKPNVKYDWGGVS